MEIYPPTPSGSKCVFCGSQKDVKLHIKLNANTSHTCHINPCFCVWMCVWVGLLPAKVCLYFINLLMHAACFMTCGFYLMSLISSGCMFSAWRVKQQEVRCVLGMCSWLNALLPGKHRSVALDCDFFMCIHVQF